MGRGKETTCGRAKEEPRVAEIHMDFLFMGEESGGQTLMFLVAKERLSKALMGSVVPSKSTGEFVAKRVVAFMREFGCDICDINVKTDEKTVCALEFSCVCVAMHRTAPFGATISQLDLIASRTFDEATSARSAVTGQHPDRHVRSQQRKA